MDRRVALAVVSAVAVASAGVGWFAGRQIQSPAEVAAAARPPEPSLITVPVELRTLSSSVVARGDVVFSESAELALSGASGTSTIVTRLPKAAGDQLAEGDVAVEVAGRPVFVLQGSLPTFRSFTPGMEGPDVRQLEEALDRLGHAPGRVDERYTAETEAAVSALYRQAGYPPTEPGSEETAALDAARDAVRAAEVELTAARGQLAEASRGVPESQRLQLEAGVAAAQQALGTATAERDEAVAAASAAVAAARAVFDAAPPQERTAAQQALDVAVADEARARRDGDAAVAEAERQVRIAAAQLREGTARADTTDAAAAVRLATTALDDARQSLARLEGQTGTSFPAAEVLFLPVLPRQVDRVHAVVGHAPEGAVLTVIGAEAAVVSAVGAADRRLVQVGATARLQDDGLGLDIPATVTFVADDAGTDGAAADRYRIRLEPLEELPEDAFGLNVRVTIPVESTGGEVLAVPLAALSAAADGSARVEVERQPGVTELVTVAPGLSAGGYVEVRPVGGSLAPGDRVVVGLDAPLDGADGDDPGAGADADDGGVDAERAGEGAG